MNIEVVREFLGWCLVLNFGMMAFSSIMVIVLRDFAADLHGKLFKLDAPTLHREFYRFLANYKIAIFIFNLIPYLALVIMSKAS